MQLHAAQEKSTVQMSPQSPTASHQEVYQTDARALQLPQNTFLFGLNTFKASGTPRSASQSVRTFHLITQKEDEYEVYSDMRTRNCKAIDPFVGDLIREHESNLMKHFIVFLDSIDPALVAKFLTTTQRITSTFEESKK